MKEMLGRSWARMLVIMLLIALAGGGCTTVKRWVGLSSPEDEELDREARETSPFPPGMEEETVVIDGKTYVRSRNPYYLTDPVAPEYVYVEKGREYVGLRENLARLFAKYSGDSKKTAGVPPEKVQEMVRQEVERLLREQGQGGLLFAARTKSPSPFPGRAVAVVPALIETPKSYEGLNLTLANNLRAELQRQRDLIVINEAATKEALAKITGKLTARHNLQALGNALGVQGVVITQVIPPGAKDSSGYLVMEVYETFQGSLVKNFLEPAPPGGFNIEAAQNAAKRDAGLVADQIRGLDWFGRIEFIKQGKVFLNVGNNSGLKPGTVLQVVQPGKEVINPMTQASLGFTADTPTGELRVTEVLGNNAAAATVISGGPFQPNDKVKAK